MAIKFNKTKGTAQKGVETFTYSMGENKLRMVGDILARYVYWVPFNGKKIPVECLAFDREEEKFNNKEKDHVQDYFPDITCGWNYAVKCIDLKTGKVVALNLKKKLFEQILSNIDDLGDPTDPVEGYDIIFEKKKTGNEVFNVEYTLSVVKCMKAGKRPLTDEEIAAVAAVPTIDEDYPRPTPAEVKATLDRAVKGDDDSSTEETQDEAAKEAVNELSDNDLDDDIPF